MVNVIDPVRWASLSRQIDELLDLAPAERERWLDSLAVGDAAGASELRALLRSRDNASAVDFMSGSASAAFLQARVEARDQLGAWTLVEMIGEGGMGSVWRARRSDGRFEGEAAVKLLRSGLFDPSAQERFRREGAILARLRQPGIAQLLDAGVTPRGQPYLVLELVDGEPMDRWCAARSLGVRARVELFLQVLDAVAAAHGQLVIHRDLKPSNILVDEAGRVKLLDFGIAHLLPHQGDAEQTALTREDALALTPRYAAPEQFQNGALSMSTDVYALGIVLYELLAGMHPGGLPPGAPALAYMQSALEGRHVAASVAAPALRRELRGDLDTILAKACAVEPAQRYASALALREELQRHLANETIVARPATLGYRLVKLVRRRPLETAAVIAVIVAVPAGAHVQAAVLSSFGLGTGVALWQLRRARQEADRARAEQRRATAVTSFIASTFSQAVPREGAGGIVTAADLLHSAHARVRDELRGQPLVAAELLAIVGDSFHELGDVSAARAVLPDAVERCEQAFGRTHPITLHARVGLAHARVVQGELAATERMLPALLADLRGAMPASASDLAAALRHSSYALTKRGDADAAVAALEEALAIAREHLGPADRHTLATTSLLGNTLATFGRDEAAIEVLQPAVEMAREQYGMKRPNTELARLEGFLASSMISVGRLSEAEELLRTVLADQWALDGCDTIRNNYTRQMLAIVRANRGDLDEGIALMRQALAADAKLNATPTVDTGTITAMLGEMLVDAGQFDEGLAAIERAEAVVVAAGGAGQEYPSIRRQIRRANALLVAGNAAAALDQAIAILDRVGDAGGRIRAVPLRVRVAALRELSRPSEADDLLPAMMLAAAQANPSSRARALLEAAMVARARGRPSEAAAFARDAVALLEPTQVPQSPLLRRAREIAARCGVG
ncbi:MAG: protein kinase domain-containing protein [Caldimonas sp.]